uniref:Uncharacterized protein n=1 Tax=Anguilla anguilla TaxID=7936 RepID=A0A0E9RB19_ANGAN
MPVCIYLFYSVMLKSLLLSKSTTSQKKSLMFQSESMLGNQFLIIHSSIPNVFNHTDPL